MTDGGFEDVIVAVVAALRQAVRSGSPVQDAAAQLRALTGASVELVQHRDPASGDVELDAIVELPDGGLVLRYCADRGAPFALRGAERLAERDLVRVDGEVLPVSQAIALLDFVWSERPVMRRLLDVCVIQAELRREPVALDAGRVQAALDRIRLANGLHTADATLRWMAERGMTHEALEAYAEDQAAILALRERVVGGRVPETLAARRADHDAATIAHLTLPDDAHHRALVERAQAERLDSLALLGLAIAAGYTPAPDAPVIRRVRRRELAAPVRDAVFGAVPGPLRVVREPGRITVVHVFAVEPALLDDATAEAIAADLFDDWLAARRAAAHIEWNWGTADRTATIAVACDRT
jgi:putative peptide maturation system protein